MKYDDEKDDIFFLIKKYYLKILTGSNVQQYIENVINNVSRGQVKWLL